MATHSMHVVEPHRKITKSTVIFLHGRGSTGDDFAEEIFEGINIVNNPLFDYTKWLFPTAPTTRSEQSNMELTEWFDLASTSNPHNQPGRQVGGLTRAVNRILLPIDEEIQQGIPASNIILGSMSQGYVTAVHVLNSYLLLHPNEPLGGFVGISGWVPGATGGLPGQLNMARAGYFGKINMPVLLTHSEDDEVIEAERRNQHAWSQACV